MKTMSHEGLNSHKDYKEENTSSHMINEWGGIVLSGFALIGASGIAINKFHIESFLLFSFVGLIVFTMLWSSSHERRTHMLVASFFAGVYLIISYLYIQTNVFFAVSYFIFSAGTMIYSVREIVDEKNNKSY